MVMHVFSLHTWDTEIEASLVYIGSPRPRKKKKGLERRQLVKILAV